MSDDDEESLEGFEEEYEEEEDRLGNGLESAPLEEGNEAGREGLNEDVVGAGEVVEELGFEDEEEDADGPGTGLAEGTIRGGAPLKEGKEAGREGA
eukprot:CAMPEP_0184665630 /NCGR_PEP_ID=MMETSP0308-20130426/58000_1 /TAXON_ID=38269 /ORGANISM="Gloeochaete witrockiana, Strain SAG 46.84" /LENGTH=95 /DNA_ID=CAMNT_0027109753 /DNA_START=401 /DNA_END=688 /DNA_ORIENTATION=-